MDRFLVKSAAGAWLKYLRKGLAASDSGIMRRFLGRTGAVSHVQGLDEGMIRSGVKPFRTHDADLAATGIYKTVPSGEGRVLYRDGQGRHFLNSGIQARQSHMENMAADAALEQRRWYIDGMQSPVPRNGNNAMPLRTNPVVYKSNESLYRMGQGTTSEMASRLDMNVRDYAGHVSNTNSILHGVEGPRFVPGQGRLYVPGKGDYGTYLNQSVAQGRFPASWAGDASKADMVGRATQAHEFSHGRVAGGSFRGHAPVSEQQTAVRAAKDIVPVQRMLRRTGFNMPGEFVSMKPDGSGRYVHAVDTRRTLLNEMGTQSRAAQNSGAVRDQTMALLGSDVDSIPRAAYHRDLVRALQLKTDPSNMMDVRGASGLLQGAINYNGHMPVLGRV